MRDRELTCKGEGRSAVIIQDKPGYGHRIQNFVFGGVIHPASETRPFCGIKILAHSRFEHEIQFMDLIL
jgi:hypothetical protein